MTFATSFGPWLAVVAVACWLGLALLEGWLIRRDRARLASATQWEGLAAGVLPRRRRRVLFGTLGVALVAFSLGRPQVSGETEWRRRGIDLVIALDFSKSMLATDIYPSRLARVRLEVDDLFKTLATDRVAIVPFAGAATHTPLTHDIEAAQALYRDLTPGDLPPGSNLGDAILVSTCLLRPDLRNESGCERIGGRGNGGAPLGGASATDDSARGESDATSVGGADERGRVLVVLTDADNDDGLPRALVETERAVEFGVSVFFVGVGTVNGDLVPDLDAAGNQRGWKRGPDGKPVTTKLGVAALDALARAAGGPDRGFILEPEVLGMPGLIARLKGIKRGDLEKQIVRQPKDVYHWFLFPGLLLLCAEALLRSRRRDGLQRKLGQL